MKKLIFGIALSLVNLHIFGQVTLAVSEIKDPKVNQKFNLTVLLEISGENMEQQTPLRMPDLSKFDIIGSASEQNTVVLDAKKGDMLNQLVYQYVLSPKQAGKIKFGSVLVTVNGKIYKTEPFDIIVRENEKKPVATAAVENMALHLELQQHSVYANEPVIALVRAFSNNIGSFRNVNKIHFPPQRNMHISQIPIPKSEIESSAGQASQVVAAYVILPSEAGILDLSPVHARFQHSGEESKLSSNRTKLRVKGLPEGMPANFHNAVGDFKVTVSSAENAEPQEIEKPINISLKVSGTGNLTTMKLPQILPSPKYTSFPPKITAQTETTQDGISGEVSADYIVVPKIPGIISVMFEPFSYFDPATKKYVEVGTKAATIDVKTADQILASKTPLEKMNDYTNTVLETVNTPILKTHNLKLKSKEGINWKIVVGNLALLSGMLAAFVLVRRKRKQKTKTFSEKKPIGSVAQTEELLREQWLPTIDDHINYLRKLNSEQNYSQFFIVYENLKTDVLAQLNLKSEHEFKEWLAANHGGNSVEKYRMLTEKIQIEKYAPFASEEEMNAILDTIEQLYQSIAK